MELNNFDNYNVGDTYIILLDYLPFCKLKVLSVDYNTKTNSIICYGSIGKLSILFNGVMYFYPYTTNDGYEYGYKVNIKRL